MASKEKRICIIADTYLDPANPERLDIGGVQSYVHALAAFLLSQGCCVDIYQKSYAGNFNKQIKDRLSVIGCETKIHGSLAKILTGITSDSAEPLIRKAFLKNTKARNYNGAIFARFERSFRVNIPSVSIQHGISFDGLLLSENKIIKCLQKMRESLRKHWQPYLERAHCLRVNNVVCVDTNYINYMRAAFPHETYCWSSHLNYIPNFTDIPNDSCLDKWISLKPPIVILFPRRFEINRGIMEWIEIVSEIGKNRKDLKFIFAGDGSYESKIRSIQRIAEVEIQKVEPHAIHELYKISNIVVIPSPFSEGTSLSAIEAMGAGCAVLASNVGGLGNIIASGYNGILCAPTKESIKKNILALISNLPFCKLLGLRARETAKVAFSREIWERRVSEVLKKTGIL